MSPEQVAKHDASFERISKEAEEGMIMGEHVRKTHNEIVKVKLDFLLAK